MSREQWAFCAMTFFLPVSSHEKTPVWSMRIKSWLEVPHINSSLNKHWYKLTIFRKTWAGATSCEGMSRKIKQHPGELTRCCLCCKYIFRVFYFVYRTNKKLNKRNSLVLQTLRSLNIFQLTKMLIATGTLTCRLLWLWLLNRYRLQEGSASSLSRNLLTAQQA